MKKIDIVKAYFNDPNNYLNDNNDIALRAIIISEILGDISNNMILDIGCGDGTLSRHFLDKNKVTFLDFSENMLQTAKNLTDEHKLKNAAFINSNFLDFNTVEKFDVVLCIGVLAHITDIKLFLSRIKSSLKKSGKIIIQISDKDKILSKCLRKIKNTQIPFILNKKRYPYQINYLSKTNLFDNLNSLGFRIVFEKYYWRPYLSISKLPSSAQIKLLTYFNKNYFISKAGTELFIVAELIN